MGPLSIYVTPKNLYLDALVKGTAMSANYQLNSATTNLQMYTAGSVPLSGANGVNVGACFSAPIAGVATFNATFTPTVTNTAALMWWGQYNGVQYGIATGFVSTSGGGGNLIVPSTSLISASAVAVSGAFKVPLNNGGTLRFNQALANAWANTILNGTNLPAMANAGVITFYSGTMPSDADTAVTTQTALATYTFASTDFSAAASGISSMAASYATTWVANGTITWARWQRGGYVMDLGVGTTGADVIVNTTNCVSGTPPNITSLTLTMP